MLLLNGSEVNTQNFFGNTPLHYAHSFGQRRIFDLIIENGGDQAIKNSKGKTPWEGI